MFKHCEPQLAGAGRVHHSNAETYQAEQRNVSLPSAALA